MGLVRLIGLDGSAVFVRASDVTGIGVASKGGSAVKLGAQDAWLVQGTPDEVHAALFPTPPGVSPAYPAEGSDPTIYLPMPDVAESLDPATYEAEWQNHSPACARAMAWALGLVRARLGVGE